ncbi:MAG: AMP-binding protein [Pseudodonghicola sp.]
MNVQQIPLAELGPDDLDFPLRHRFARVALFHAARPALVDDAGSLSYAELLTLASRYAHVISARLPAGAPVALCMTTNRHVVAAMLGALFVGRPYVPLDPAYPADHLNRVIAHSGARLVIGCSQQDLAPLGDLAQLGIDAATSADVQVAPVSFQEDARADSPAYIIYTSGSTGAPKGVWQDQRGLLHDVMQYTQMVHPGCEDRHSLLYSPCVNGALRDIYGSILNGATLCLSDLRREGLRKVLHDLIARRVTLLHAMPPVLRSLIRVAEGPICPEARLLYTAGDRFLTQDLLAVRANLPAGCAIYTGIGSTECATLYRQWIIPDDLVPETELVPVGYPVEQREMRLVDETGREVAAGTIGQIRVCSPYIARGYWNDEALTRQGFSADPDRPGWRCFQPGDLGRARPDGLLDFLGRADRQIKIRGFRIEPAETEAALRRIDGIAEAAILPRQQGDRTSLVAFVEPSGGATLEEDAIRRRLQQSLPPQLQPERVIVLDPLPRLGNFKLDVKALRGLLEQSAPLPATADGLPDGYLALWARVFKRPVGPDTALEAIGADSLELLELELLLERDLKISVRGSLGPEATPRTVWHTAVPAMERELARYTALDEKLHALAALMAPSTGIPLDPDGLVRLYNHGGDRMPLLWCFNQVSEANALAGALGPDQPLIAMRSLAGLYDGDAPAPGDERQVAERYIQIVLARRLPQRVAVGGNCQAAPFAFQVANALALSGHLAASLILLEKMLPVPYGGRTLMLFGRDSRSHNPAFQFANPTAGWDLYLRHGHAAPVDGAHGSFFQPENIGSLSKTLRDEIDAAAAVPPLPGLARRARISARVISAPDRQISLRIANPNEVAFEPGAHSHICVAIHALDDADNLARPLRVPDLTLPLPRRIAAGAEIALPLSLPADRFATGTYLVSLCEEGVDWFALTPGSDPVIRL